jgi:hypothetical protein
MNTKLSFKQSITAGLIAAGAAVVVNTVLFFILKSAGIFVDTILIDGNNPLTIVPVIISSIAPTLIASMVFFLLDKFTSNGFKIFTIVAIVLGAVSFMSPFSIPAVTTGFAIGLNLMHVVVVLSLLIFIKRAVKQNA